MSRNEFLDSSWPVTGFDKLGTRKQFAGQASEKDAVTSSIKGLSYLVRPHGRDKNSYDVTIKGWRYSVRNETIEFPILSFSCLNPFESKKSKQFVLQDIKVNARPLIINERSSQRSLMAAIFIMRHIEKGQVPDTNRILRLYKVHPSQHSLYEMSERPQNAKRRTTRMDMSAFVDGTKDLRD